MSFDHAVAISSATGDCAYLHAGTSAPSFSSWRQGHFHCGRANPPTCLPCHDGERPTSANGSISPTYKNSPFDYGRQRLRLDPRRRPGLRALPFRAGHRRLGRLPRTGPAATSTTLRRRTRRRPASPVTRRSGPICNQARPRQPPRPVGFDHAAAGAGQCLRLSRGDIAAGRFVDYTNPTTQHPAGRRLEGGVGYPGSTFAGSSDQSITVTETQLVRDGSPANNVLRTVTITDTIYNGMLHTSSILPAPMSAAANTPDITKCWHCHTSNDGTVTSFNNGKYHDALTNFRAPPSGAVTPYPQPDSQLRRLPLVHDARRDRPT